MSIVWVPKFFKNVFFRRKKLKKVWNDIKVNNDDRIDDRIFVFG